jgi:steroid 5-alpha reductase family enzyme
MPDNTPLWHAALAGLVFTLGGAVLTWLASLVRRDVSLVDRVWAVLIVGAGWVYLVRLPTEGLRGLAMLLLASLWALRLSLFITWRNWGHGEERRYQEIRARNEPGFALKSLYLVFALQAVLAWTVSAPFLAAARADRPWSLLDMLGLALAAFGLVFEAVGDWQLARFKADPAHRGQVMDRGLWRYTRHPNYFGEACVWWGLWLTAVAGAGWAGAWSIVSPLLMTLLLLKVSGVSLLEKDIGERRPAYRAYIARTNAFFPGPVRRHAG